MVPKLGLHMCLAIKLGPKPDPKQEPPRRDLGTALIRQQVRDSWQWQRFLFKQMGEGGSRARGVGRQDGGQGKGREGKAGVRGDWGPEREVVAAEVVVTVAAAVLVAAVVELVVVVVGRSSFACRFIAGTKPIEFLSLFVDAIVYSFQQQSEDIRLACVFVAVFS